MIFLVLTSHVGGAAGLSIDKSAEAALKVLENEVFPVQTVTSTVKSALTVLQPLSTSIPSQVTSYLSSNPLRLLRLALRPSRTEVKLVK